MKNNIILFSPYCEIGYKVSNKSMDLIRFYVEDAGHKVDYYDLSGGDYHYKKIKNILSGLDSPIIGITGYTRERFHAYRLIRQIKKVCPSSIIVVGGHHFGHLPDETLKSLPEVDVVVRGEGEITFKLICEAIINDESFENINGITYRCSKPDYTGNSDVGIRSTPDAVIEKNIDQFRTWDPVYFEENYKIEVNSPKMDPSSKYLSVMATRGCPSSCNFCSLSSDVVRFRSISHVVDEIEGKIKISGIKKVAFQDSSLTVNKNYVRELCDEILARNLCIEWQCYSRVDLGKGLLAYMRKAGCIGVEVALESGSPKVLKSIGKGISVEKYIDFCKLAYDLGIKVWTFIIVSSTDETYNDALLTYDVLHKTARHTYDFGVQVTRITPDTKLDQIARDKGVLNKDFDWFDEGYINLDERLFKTDMYETLPLYIEKMTVNDISDILEKYDQLKNEFFVYNDGLIKIILENLRLRMLRKLTLKKLFKKIVRFFIMLSNIRVTKDKVNYYQRPNISMESIDRPEWESVNKRDFNAERKKTHSQIG